MNSTRATSTRATTAVAAWLLLAGFLNPGMARADLTENPEFQASLAALADSLPGVAARKLEGLLQLPDADTDELRPVRLRLAEALVRSGRHDDAVTAASHRSIESDPDARFWKALALVALERPAEAEKLLAPLSENPDFPHQGEAGLTRAALLETLGDASAAVAALKPLTRNPKTAVAARIRAAEIELRRENPEAAAGWIEANPVGPESEEGRAEFDFLRARIAMAAGRPEEASDLFHALTLSQSERIPVSIRHGAFLGEADAHAAAGKPDRTAKSLLKLAATHPESPLLESAFRRLEKFGLLRMPNAVQRLTAWSRDQSIGPRKPLAAYFLGVSLRQTGQNREAIGHFTEFRKDFPKHPLATAAALETAELLVGAGRHGQAAKAIAELRAQTPAPEVLAYLEGLEARAGFARGDYVMAAAKFADSAELSKGPSGDFNAAVAALYADDPATFEKFATRLQQSNETELGAELMLEQGLHFAAADAKSEAFETLEEFLRLHGTHPRTPDARLALAELYLNDVPAQEVPAREQLEAARKESLTPEQRERLDYVAIWVEIGAGDDQAIAAAGGRFIETWKTSTRRPRVFMILGEAYFRMQDYANAITYFESLAEEAPDSEFAIPALFFAAKAASLTLVAANQQFAIETWARVAEAGGPLEAPARHEQGLLKLTLDQVDDAIFAFDSILAMEEIDPDLRIAVLCDKGQALFTKGTAAPDSNDNASLEAAIEAFETVENDPAAARSWKYQSAVRRGNCLESLGRTDEALEVYYDIIRSGGPLGPVASVPVEEFDWFFRAGIAATQLLQQQENWEAAVKIADRLAQAGGPRAAEAANIADRLRLQHFIWDEPEE